MIAIIGGGPAGLRAAEVAARAGALVTVFEAKPSVGRKFLIAGKGGLNLTNDEACALFAARYEGGGAARWTEMLDVFGGPQVRAWAAELGCETFVASSGRVYPRALKAAPLLRSWVRRLRELGVQFRLRHRWCGVRLDPLRLRFEDSELAVDAVVLALGGASWPETGSDGKWPALLEEHGVEIAPFAPANCGWEIAWPARVVELAEGAPLKNVAVSTAGENVRGELLITKYGLEGGALYQLGSRLRRQSEPAIEIDFKPDSTVDQLARKLTGVQRDVWRVAAERWRLPEAARLLIEVVASSLPVDALDLAARVKALRIPLQRPRPIEEAISTTGGVAWSEVNERLMLRRLPGVFVAGEMLDWEAPTGGYLLTGAFATGDKAGTSAAEWGKISSSSSSS